MKLCEKAIPAVSSRVTRTGEEKEQRAGQKRRICGS